MKKVLVLLIALSLCFIACFSLSACNVKDGESDNQSTSQPSDESKESGSDSFTSGSFADNSVGNSSTASKSVREPEEIVPSQIKYTGSADGIKPVTIFMVGDSTVCQYKAEPVRKTMRNGYGMRLGEYLNDKVTIKNLALSGRSSKSFLTEANYQTLKNEIKEGDFLIIGFGHNDEKPEATRYTNASGALDEEGSFKKSLNDNYIKLAIEKGATPILCTPIVRRSSSGIYSGSKIHNVAPSGTYESGDYAQAIRDLGIQTGVTVIDLTTLTKNLLTGMSNEDSQAYYSIQYVRSPSTKQFSEAIDDTHINAYGAQVVAKMLAETLKTTDNTLKNYVLETLPTPNRDVVVVNPVPTI